MPMVADFGDDGEISAAESGGPLAAPSAQLLGGEGAAARPGGAADAGRRLALFPLVLAGALTLAAVAGWHGGVLPALSPGDAVQLQMIKDESSLFPSHEIGLELTVISTTTRTTTTLTTTTKTTTSRTTTSKSTTSLTTTSASTSSAETTITEKIGVIWGGGGKRSGSVARTHVMTGEQCNDVHAAPLPNDFPRECAESWSSFDAEEAVLKQCALVNKWNELAEKTTDQGNCVIDPTTHVMTCKKHLSCSGGGVTTAQMSRVVRNVTYNCGVSCQGALLADCCLTCQQYRDKPQDIDVDVVTCVGCGEEQIAREMEKADCALVDGKFDCRVIGQCASGVAETSCEIQDYSCNVVPCDKCSSDELKAQCCAGCLADMCDFTNTVRMVCQGCDTLPGTGNPWWQPKLPR